MKTIKAISDPSLRVDDVVCEDLIILMRPIKNELGSVVSYNAQTIELKNFCASILAQSLGLLGNVLPRKDPADGKSLWVKDGCLAFASGDPMQLSTVAPTAMKQSLKEVFKSLPTSDPCDGSPWLNGNVLMQGSNISNKGMNK